MSYDEDIDAYTTTSRSEVLFYLRQLINDGERLNVSFDEGNEALLTMAIALNEETGVLILDWGGSETVNRRLLQSPRATFVANPLGVRNLFQVGRVWETEYRGRPAFATEVPKKYVRLQRREFFRLTLPVTRRLKCVLSALDAGATKEWHLEVVDIGVGGVGLEIEARELPFACGQVIPGTLIDLGRHGVLNQDLEVRYTRSVVRGLKKFVHVGCRFVHLNPAQEKSLQQFITHMQCEHRD